MSDIEWTFGDSVDDYTTAPDAVRWRIALPTSRAYTKSEFARLSGAG
jgi:hypothetical protein